MSLIDASAFGRRPRRPVVLACTLATLLLPAVSATVVAPAELAEARQWATAKFEGRPATSVSDPGLVVIANNDPVQKNARAGRPLKIVDREFTRGLYCHASSHVIVRLPAPATTFQAVIGVDSNEQTSGGRGSIDFSVQVAGAERFRSGVMREGMPGRAIEVPLERATEFSLLVDPTADGIGCDQADWADARVTLEDGRQLWLADLPLREGGERAPYTAALPFSFTYGGQASADCLRAWPLKREWRRFEGSPRDRRPGGLRTSEAPPPASSGPADARPATGYTEFASTWSDPATGLEVRWLAVEYHDFPTVEWTVYFKNTGTQATPLLTEVAGLDTRFERSGQREFTLHHHKGTFVRADDFEPLTTVLAPNQTLRFAPPAGRPLGHVFPYFNLAGQDEGAIVVVGWPGQWAARFERDAGRGVRVAAGQEKVNLRLAPGEEIRTPLMVLQFWRGDWQRAQNVWRRWMFAHNVPEPGGRTLSPQMAACSSHQFGEMINANEGNQKFFVDRYLGERLPLDYWWMDAGWYYHYGEGWPKTGTWEVDRGRFPNGLRSISDHARARSVKTIVWFEPERVTPGTFLYTNNPAWLLGKDGGQKLLNLGHADARAWLVDHVSRSLVEQGIDLYRQDYNVDPLGYWRGAEGPEREGATENHYVTGYLAYWDELLRRHPGLLIDTCASGGHRNDLETLRRSVPLLRSDYIMEPVGQQCHTYALAFWIPFFGTGTSAMDSYNFRSQMCPHFTACFDMRRADLPFADARRLLAQWKERIAPNYFGDFHPLTSYSTSQDLWLAWQFHRPEVGRGVVQAFRRAQSVYESARLPLRALNPAARYAVTDLDRPEVTSTSTGRELMESGLLVAAPQRPAALVFVYEQVR